MTVAASGAFGAGAAIDEADPTDGVLEVLAIEAGPRLGLVGLAYRLRTGGVTDHPRAFHSSCTTAEVLAPDHTAFNVDGELVTIGPARFTVQPGAHFTSPIAEAALVHCLTACSIPALMEILGDGSRSWPYLTRVYDFKNGKMWPNERPGLGVEVDTSKLTKIAEYNVYRAGMLLNHRPDGSYTQW